ncbi:MAG: ABC transporter permease [Elusimicrobiaceae bacterium]|nr:ABC transporter permease [Elusimicrobiaceae bacterium]
MSETLLLALRELKGLLKDKGLLLLALGGPFLYSFFYPLPYQHKIVRQMPVAVVDADKTNTSFKLKQMIKATEQVALTEKYLTLQEAQTALKERKIYAAVYIPKDFQKNILSNQIQAVKIWTDGSYIIYYKQATKALQTAIKTMSAGIEIKKLQAKGAGKAAYALRSPVNIIERDLYNPSGSYMQYVVPAVFVAVIHQVLLMIIGMRSGTLRESKKRYSPTLRPINILFGKTLAFLFFAMCYFAFYFVLVYRLLGFSGGGAVLSFFIFYFIFVLSVIFLGIFIAQFFNERETSVMFIVVSSLPLFFMSGAVWPVYQMPFFIQILRLFVPLSYGIEGMTRLFIMQEPLFQALPLLVGMFIYMLIVGILAYYTIKKRYPNKI